RPPTPPPPVSAAEPPDDPNDPYSLPESDDFSDPGDEIPASDVDTSTSDVDVTTPETENEPYMMAAAGGNPDPLAPAGGSEHDNNARPSTEEKHEEGKA